MTSISAPCSIPEQNKPSYNAVKIKVNNPSVNVANPNYNGEGIYNAVSLEVNRPSVNVGKPIYRYPQHKGPIPAELAIPVAYQTNLINNRTYVNAELDVKEKKQKTDAREAAPVPAPNYTTTEEEKDLTFHGVEIIPPSDIKPNINIDQVISNLSDKNYDIQALQMEEIVKQGFENPAQIIPYIVSDVFDSLNSIAKADNSRLEKPSEKQIDARKKIIINEIVKEQAIAAKQDLTKIELPYKISEEEYNLAAKLTPFEEAERNKEYAILTIAMLAKVYADEIEKSTGNVVPFTDMPGVSTFVETLRYSQNSDLKVAAIEALLYIKRPEYKDELKSIMNIASSDTIPYVSKSASAAIKALEK